MALPRTYPIEDPLAQVLELIGDRWTLLVLREVLDGRSRFRDIRERLGLASNVLADRLQRLTAAGLLTREPVPGDNRGHAYRPGERAVQVRAVISALHDLHGAAGAAAGRADGIGG